MLHRHRSATPGHKQANPENVDFPNAAPTTDGATGLVHASGGQLEGHERYEDATSVEVPSLSGSLSITDMWSSAHSNTPSSSSPIVLPLSPPLPPNTDLLSVLTDTRLTLDVYRAGAAVLPVLWRFVPGQLRELQYLRLGSEDDEQGLEEALAIIPHFTRLRSLAVRGTQNRHLSCCCQR